MDSNDLNDTDDKKKLKRKLNFLHDKNHSDYYIYKGLTNFREKVIYFNVNGLFQYKIKPLVPFNKNIWYKDVVKLILEDEEIFFYLDDEKSKTPLNDIYEYLQDINLTKRSDDNIKKNNDNSSFSHEQKKIYNEIIQINEKNSLSIFGLIGAAGTGKTFCLKQFTNKLFIYITLQNNLCRETEQKLNLSSDNVFTLCSFIIKLFNISFFEYCELERFIISNNVIDYDHFFDQLELKHDFLDSIILENKYIYICIDEVSMIPINVIKLIKESLQRYIEKKNVINAENDKYCITILLCGDCHQIQPIYFTKNLKERKNDFSFKSPGSSVVNRYDLEYLTLNCQKILSFTKKNFFFTTQIRCNNNHYIKFIENLQTSSTWIADILNYFKDICKEREIFFLYNCNLLEKLDSSKYKNFEDFLYFCIEWIDENYFIFNNFKYFSWCNVDMHYINCMIFYTSLKQFNEHLNTMTDNFERQKFNRMKPKLANLKFFINGNLYACPTNTTYLPFLPLIIGMEYKVLLTVKNKLCRGDVVILIEANENGQFLLCYSKSQCKFIKIYPSLFTMTLYTMDRILSLSKYNKNKQKFVNTKIFGFPIQLNCADTIRSSIGMTVERKDIYINLNGCSLQETYVILSRATNIDQIKGIYIH
ncbi:hypothetical protein LbFV_ORF68 [Leptopilina boulardi filamentous virus]|uniref:DNA helicase n=1 Tax=Leptopilina boulardi filamentous virus TaxID=552509 RepID=A0A1S5YDA6_9VIRU|nr:hypothetical protein LbFV_ORF68 [Leptopilina boulardi filamentous virus]AQQ79988.1 hypothetical protein LbFV_ORF68 [Leptopilina boulardi filamentous virus]